MYTYTHGNIYMYIYVHVCMHIYTCSYVHIYSIYRNISALFDWIFIRVSRMSTYIMSFNIQKYFSVILCKSHCHHIYQQSQVVFQKGSSADFSILPVLTIDDLVVQIISLCQKICQYAFFVGFIPLLRVLNSFRIHSSMIYIDIYRQSKNLIDCRQVGIES